VKVVMKHVSGSAKDNLERAKEEMTRVLGFLIVEIMHISAGPVKPWWEKSIYKYSRRMNLTNEAVYVINSIRSQEVLPNPGSGGAP
jgi:enoyl-[acyl-carrier-protein] reductase (NADH)